MVLMECHGTAAAAAATHRQERGEVREDAQYPRFVTMSLKAEVRQPTPLGGELAVRGRIHPIERRTVWIALSLEADGRTCAT